MRIETKVSLLVQYLDTLRASRKPLSAPQCARRIGHETTDPHRWLAQLANWKLVTKTLHGDQVRWILTELGRNRIRAVQLVGQNAPEPMRQRSRAHPITESWRARAQLEAQRILHPTHESLI